MKCLNLFRLLQRCTLLGRRGGVSGNSTATRPGINQAGRRSAAQVAMPPLSLVQLACPALCALLPLRSATLGFFPRDRKEKITCHLPTRSPRTHRACDARCIPGLSSPLNSHFGRVSGPWCCAALRYSFASENLAWCDSVKF